MIKTQALAEFLDQLAGPSPTPGGGSAAAITGAMAAALVGMVCNLTIGKKNYVAVEAEMRGLLQQAESLRGRLTDLIQADVTAFDAVMAAYRLPRDSEVAAAARRVAVQAALKQATESPLQCAEAAAAVLKLCRPVAVTGNANAVSDAGVAVLAAYAAARSAALNVYVNTAAIEDKDFVARCLERLDRALQGLDAEQEAVFQLVKARCGG